MKKLLLLACACLAACGAIGRRDPSAAVYDLGLPQARLPSAAGVPLLALEVRAPAWLESPGIKYRLAYAEGERLRDYTQARWAAAPALLLQQRLAQRLDLVPVGQGGAACLLRIDVDEFSQVFDTAQDSRGVVQARLALMDRNRNRLADISVNIEKPSPSPDSRGGVAALTAAAETLAGEVGRWAGELAGSGRLKACERRSG